MNDEKQDIRVWAGQRRGITYFYYWRDWPPLPWYIVGLAGNNIQCYWLGYNHGSLWVIGVSTVLWFGLVTYLYLKFRKPGKKIHRQHVSPSSITDEIRREIERLPVALEPEVPITELPPDVYFDEEITDDC